MDRRGYTSPNSNTPVCTKAFVPMGREKRTAATTETTQKLQNQLGDYNFDYLDKGPNTALISEELTRFKGPKVDEHSFVPRMKLMDFARTDTRYLIPVTENKEEEKKDVDVPQTKKLSQRERNLRKRNVLLNRFLGPLEETEENNNDIFKGKNNVGSQPFEEAGDDIIVNTISEPLLLTPSANKPKRLAKDGLAIVDLNAVVEKLNQEGYSGAKSSSPSSRSSSCNSQCRRTTPPKKRIVDDGRDEEWDFQKYQQEVRKKQPLPYLLKPLEGDDTKRNPDFNFRSVYFPPLGK